MDLLQKMWRLFFLFLSFIEPIYYCPAVSSCSSFEGKGKLTDHYGPCMDEGKRYGLTRHNPVKVGHVQEIDLGSFGKRSMITKAVKPPIFEIPDFLTTDECDHIMKQAGKQGLENSVAKGGLTPKLSPILPDNVTGSIKPNELGGQFEHWDRDKDGVITLLEVLKFARRKRLLFLNKEEIVSMIKKLNITEAEDGTITMDEFQTANTLGMDTYFDKLHRLHPKHRDRYSEQTWIKFGSLADQTMSRILRRVAKLTKLPSEIVHGGEELQVVRYQPYGHYHAHYDSETHARKNVACCHQVLQGKRCRLCRYVTVLYYLNDNYTGGETAFPFADNITMDIEKAKIRKLGKDPFNLNEYCHDSNLVVKQKRGTAMLWYNHKMDYKNGGWLGDLDDYSLHGGCMVTEGEKWIANNWLTAPYHHTKEIPSIFLRRFEVYSVRD